MVGGGGSVTQEQDLAGIDLLVGGTPARGVAPDTPNVNAIAYRRAGLLLPRTEARKWANHDDNVNRVRLYVGDSGCQSCDSLA